MNVYPSYFLRGRCYPIEDGNREFILFTPDEVVVGMFESKETFIERNTGRRIKIDSNIRFAYLPTYDEATSGDEV